MMPMKAIIRKGRPEEFDAVRKLYDICSVEVNEWGWLPNGCTGTFPGDALVRRSLSEGGLFVAEISETGELVGAIIANHDAVPEYKDVAWQRRDLEDTELYNLHALRMLKKCQGRGFARALMQAVIEDAREQGLKALRLDTVMGNDAAVNIYTKLGFEEICRRDMHYDDIGNVVCIFYELLL